MRYAKQLQLAIDSTIAAMLQTGMIGSADVSDVVLGSHRRLIQHIALDLAEKSVRRMVTDAMKKVSTVDDGAEQGALFEDMKGLPQALSIEVKGEVKYISRSRARRAHWKAHIEYLDRLILADVSRKRMVALANDRLEMLRAKFGDLSEAELMRKAKAQSN